MRKAALIITGWCLGMAAPSTASGMVIDFEDLAGKPVPDDYGGLNWVDPTLGNYWEVDPNHLPQNHTPCALFDAGETPVQVRIRSESPIDFVSIEFTGLPGDKVKLYGDGPGEDRYGVDYSSHMMELDGTSIFHFEEQWLRITSLTIYFDSLFPGSIFIDNVAFEPSPRLATIFKEDFDSFTSDQEMWDDGWDVRHGQYPAQGGGIWHLDPTRILDGLGVVGLYVISDSDAEGELPPPKYIDESVVSPEIDCTEFAEVHLEFRQNVNVYDENDFPEVFNVYVSNDPAHENWESNQVPFWKEDRGDTPYPRCVDISEFADGKKIKIRWRYTANYDNWWAIDDVRVIGRPALELSSFELNAAAGEVSIAWDAPDGFFAIEASDDSTFSSVTELATGITQKQWSGTDPEVSHGQRFYRVRMD